MRNFYFFLIYYVFAALFYQSAALRRIKRDEAIKQPGDSTKDTVNIGKDLVRIWPDPMTKDTAKEQYGSKDETLKEKEKPGSPLSTPLQHAISSALASASDSSKHGKLQYSSINDLGPKPLQTTNANTAGNNNINLNSENDEGATAVLLKAHQKSHNAASVATSENNLDLGKYLFGKHKRGERFDQNVIEHESVPADAGNNSSSGGAPEVEIIDNSLQPITYSSNYKRKPNLRSMSCNVKRITELTNSNIKNHNNINNDHDGGGVDTEATISAADAALHNKINSNNVNNDLKSKNHNDNSNSNSDSNILKRHNNNANVKRNNNGSNRSNNDNSKHDSCIDRTKKQERKSVSSLLSSSTKTNNKNQKLDQQQQQLMKLHQHDGEHTQQQQLLGHLNGKLSSMENVIKFADMLLYKVGLDGAPIHAQGAQYTINSNPTITFAANSPTLDGDDFDAIDYFYNTLDTQPALMRSPNAAFMGAAPPTILSATGRSGSATKESTTALIGPPRPFFIQSQYSSYDPKAQPLNFLESALDFLLAGAGGEDDGEDEIELRCPLHHEPIKKSLDTGGESEIGGGGGAGSGSGSDPNDLIQVCSCRFFKKKKNA